MKYEELLQIYKPADVEFQLGSSIGMGVSLTSLDMLKLQNVMGGKTSFNWTTTTGTLSRNPDYINVSFTTTSMSPINTKDQDLTQLEQLLHLNIGGKNNTYEGKQIIIDSDRLILNAKDDYAFMFAKGGMSLSTQGELHFDSNSDIYAHSNTGIYLGIPENEEKESDQDYEPLVLGKKLVDLLEDLILVLKKLKVSTNVGDAYIDSDTQKELIAIQEKLPEILSRTAYVEGRNHEVSNV